MQCVKCETKTKLIQSLISSRNIMRQVYEIVAFLPVLNAQKYLVQGIEQIDTILIEIASYDLTNRTNEGVKTFDN